MKNKTKWIQYKIEENESVLRALQSGKISGKYKKGSYWRECTLRIGNNTFQNNLISSSKETPNIRQENTLSSIVGQQRLRHHKMAENGYSVGHIYNFLGL